METVNNKLERLRAKAELFLKEDIKVFLKTYDNDYYFCNILLVDEDYITIYNFRGKRKGEKNRLLWLDVDELEEYKEETEEVNN